MNLDDQIQLVAFRVGTQEFALEILQVERILRYERPAPLPKAPDFLEGVITYDGIPVPVVDLRKRLEVPAPIDDQTRLMVLALETQRVAVIVDEVREVLRLDSTTIIAPPPIVRGLAAAYIAGLVTRGERTLVLLQAAKLLSSTERLALSDAGAAP
ncbi:MAG: chemotaxis protein CheW [Gemmatimonadales bacterium]